MVRRQRLKKECSDPLGKWTVDDAVELYGVDRWGAGLFSVNKQGHVCLVGHNGTPEVDLKELVEEIRLRGMKLPVLIRFTDILRSRMGDLHEAFQQAFLDNEYDGAYRGVYPIKVNQHRHTLEDIVAVGKKHHFGLEAGSKSELVLAIAHQTDPEALIVCNGFKDRAYVRTALEARRLGHKIFLVIEKPSELDLIVKIARELKVEPLLGIRMKLASRGKGMWESSGGSRSKFGLYASEIITAIRQLRRARMLESLQLLHFHIGSQITDIHAIKNALREACAFYSEIRALGAPISYLDVGGGLAVDYDGSHTNFASSANYGMKEYAADVVSAVVTACQESDAPHPTIITECGRAMTAYQSLLVMETISTNKLCRDTGAPKIKKKAPEVVRRIAESYDSLSPKNFQEVYHDAVEARREALMLFNLRHLSLEDRAHVETYFWMICERIARYAETVDYLPDELHGIQALMSTMYYCNFSLFQSVPDHWAIKQLFPVMPLQRLDEKPDVEALLADITCDSDGVMDRFVDLRDVRNTLPLHPLRSGEHYDIGVFLVGAYQEILGDLHNLFGDTTVVHVSNGPGGYVIDKTVEGDRIRDVIGYVAYAPSEVLGRLRAQVERAVKDKQITLAQSAEWMRHFETMLDEHTYLS